MKTLKILAVLAVIGIGVALAQVPVKIGSLTRVSYAPGNSVLMITLPGVTNYAITVEDFKLNTIGSMQTNTVVINNSVVTNQLVYQTNINNYTTTTNLVVYETNINNVSITTNLYSSNIFTTNITVSGDIYRTNRTVTIATNATSSTLNFLSDKDWYEVPALLVTNLVLSPTNLMAGREVWIFFSAANGNYDVTITNTAGDAIRWNMNGPTNGSTSFTVTNGQRAELVLTCRSNNVIHAVYGHYR